MILARISKMGFYTYNIAMFNPIDCFYHLSLLYYFKLQTEHYLISIKLYIETKFILGNYQNI